MGTKQSGLVAQIRDRERAVMIPKVLHYCWFGATPKSELVEFCIQSWKVHCPEYEIVEWNEKTFDLAQSDFATAAFQRRKFAFVSDVVRAHVLSKHGGIYLDSDVEVKASLDRFLTHSAFTGFQQRGIPFTAVWGSEKGHSLAEKVLRYYQDADPEAEIGIPNTGLVTEILVSEFGVDISDDQLQHCAHGLVVYPSNIFCINLPENIATHHFAGSWLELATPTHYSHIVLASFYLDALRKMERKGIRFSHENLNLEQDVSFGSDLDRILWHLSQIVGVAKRRLAILTRTRKVRQSS